MHFVIDHDKRIAESKHTSYKFLFDYIYFNRFENALSIVANDDDIYEKLSETEIDDLLINLGDCDPSPYASLVIQQRKIPTFTKKIGLKLARPYNQPKPIKESKLIQILKRMIA